MMGARLSLLAVRLRGITRTKRMYCVMLYQIVTVYNLFWRSILIKHRAASSALVAQLRWAFVVDAENTPLLTLNRLVSKAMPFCALAFLALVVAKQALHAAPNRHAFREVGHAFISPLDIVAIHYAALRILTAARALCASASPCSSLAMSPIFSASKVLPLISIFPVPPQTLHSR